MAAYPTLRDVPNKLKVASEPNIQGGSMASILHLTPER